MKRKSIVLLASGAGLVAGCNGAFDSLKSIKAITREDDSGIKGDFMEALGKKGKSGVKSADRSRVFERFHQVSKGKNPMRLGRV